MSEGLKGGTEEGIESRAGLGTLLMRVDEGLGGPKSASSARERLGESGVEGREAQRSDGRRKGSVGELPMIDEHVG